MDPLILVLGTSWVWPLSYVYRPFYPEGKEPGNMFGTMAGGGFQNLFGLHEEDEILHLLGVKI
jgi:hypothetical protein